MCVSMVVSMEICWHALQGKKIFRHLTFNLVITLLAKHKLRNMHLLCTISSSGTMYFHNYVMYMYLHACVSPPPKSPSHTHCCMSYSSADEVTRCILSESLVSILIYIRQVGKVTSVPTEHPLVI